MANVPNDGIDLPSPRPRTRGRLVDVAMPIPGFSGRWAGVEWLPWPGVDDNRDGVLCETVYDKTPRDLPELENQPAFLLWDALTCSTLGISLSTLGRLLTENVTDFLSATLAMELESGTGSGGASLASTANVVTSAAVPLKVAMAMLEDHLGSALHGGLGVIHLTPGLFTLAIADGLVDETTHKTPTGHDVIGDAGHTGVVDPADGGAVGEGERYIYASGDIWYATSAVKGVLTVESEDAAPVYIPQNDNRPLVERYGLIVFNQDLVGAALVDYETSV